MPSQIHTVPGCEDFLVAEETSDVEEMLDRDDVWLRLTVWPDTQLDEPLLVRSETVIAVQPS